MAAICVGIENDISIEKIAEGIKEFELTKKRMEIKKGINNSIIINDCYNANDESMTAAIEYLGTLKVKRKIVVLGDMLELGAFEKELHEKVGKEIYKNQIDIIMCQGEASKYITNKVKELGMKEVYQFETKEELIEKLKHIIQKDDYILIKASHGMHFEDITEAIENKE